MPDIRFSCPQCSQHLEAEPSLRGEIIQCPSCQVSMTVPPAEIRGKSIASNAFSPGQGPCNRRPVKTRGKKGIVLALMAGLIIGYFAGAGIPVIGRSSGLLDRVRPVSAQRMTKDEWKTKAYAYFKSSGEYEGQGHMLNPTLLWGIDGEVFKRVMGKPDRTQTIGSNMYWYYTCRDGVIQLVLENREGLDNLLVGDVNDY